MTDRVPTPGKEGRVKLTFDDESVQYAKIEMADEPTQEGTPLNKATLLSDSTAEILGFGADDDPTVNDAFLAVMVNGGEFCLVTVHVYETGTTTPIPGVLITGLTSLSGGEVYADENGRAIAKSESSTATVRVSPYYVDLTSSAVTVQTPIGTIIDLNIYATRVSNTSTKEVTVTSTQTFMFTDRVASVDVHVVGGGNGGDRGSASYNGGGHYTMGASHGNGGRAGGQSYKTGIKPTANYKYIATIGLGGDGLSQTTENTSDDHYAISYKSGNKGGNSSFMGVSANGGSGESGGTGYWYYYDSDPDETDEGGGTSGTSSTVGKYGTGSVVAGGGGGGAGGTNGYAGGTPYGGKGGKAGAAGSNATGYGGGGGGGGVVNTAFSSATAYASGDGGDGVVFFRWRYN